MWFDRYRPMNFVVSLPLPLPLDSYRLQPLQIPNPLLYVNSPVGLVDSILVSVVVKCVVFFLPLCWDSPPDSQRYQT